MSDERTEIASEYIDHLGISENQKEDVLALIEQIRSDVLLISTRKFEVGIVMARLFDIAGHGSFEQLRKRFFPEVPKRSAQRYTAVGREFGLYKEQVMDIGFSYLGKLAEQECLRPIRMELIEKVKLGDVADGHYYRGRISELLSEEFEIETFREEVSGAEKSVSKNRKSGADRKDAVRRENIDDQSMNIVDKCIPTNPKQLQALWNVLSTTKGRQEITNYLYRRVSDLVRHRMMQHLNDVDEKDEDSVESVCQ